ncbi:hypothetical protein B0H17DRAFT_1326532, partial [Mycena rosella]
MRTRPLSRFPHPPIYTYTHTRYLSHVALPTTRRDPPDVGERPARAQARGLAHKNRREEVRGRRSGQGRRPDGGIRQRQSRGAGGTSVRGVRRRKSPCAGRRRRGETDVDQNIPMLRLASDADSLLGLRGILGILYSMSYTMKTIPDDH